MWRVVWQFASSEARAADSKSGVENANSIRELWSDLTTSGQADPVFDEPPQDLRIQFASDPDLMSDPAMNFAGYHQLFVEEFQEASALVARLHADPTIRYADLQGQWKHPVMFGRDGRAEISESASTDVTSLIGEQGYLRPAPDGVDALHAWSIPGGRGDGVRICDIESGWNFEHQDLRLRDNQVLYGKNDFVEYDDGSDSDSHGTAVLGIFHGDGHDIGVRGIASESTISGASAIYDDRHKKWNAAAAIKFAADHWLRRGDIILIEMHAPGPNTKTKSDFEFQRGFIPIEYWLPEFAAIKYAVRKGVYVVEAAGNGGEDLDAPVYRSAFSRRRRDSGAILVGGGESMHDAHPRSRISWSNYGERLDAQGWGYDIVTTGGREGPRYYDRIDDKDSSKCYTRSFGGTSGASPIVTGVVACISGALRAAGKPPLPPLDMRRLLDTTGSPQGDSPKSPAAQRIGKLPDLKAALHKLSLDPKAEA
jgi:hypothetical protein